MRDLVQELLEAGALPASRFPPTSRYAGIDVATLVPDDGRPAITYLRRRLVPQPDRLALLAEHHVVERDRPDLLAARYLSDPELWWRIADANVELDPLCLCEPVGRRLRIGLTEGMPGAPDD